MKKLLAALLILFPLSVIAEDFDFVRNGVIVTRVSKNQDRVKFCYEYQGQNECLRVLARSNEVEFLEKGDMVTIHATSSFTVNDEVELGNAVDIHGFEINFINPLN
jgi:hypothetical protein